MKNRQYNADKRDTTKIESRGNQDEQRGIKLREEH